MMKKSIASAERRSASRPGPKPAQRGAQRNGDAEREQRERRGVRPREDQLDPGGERDADADERVAAEDASGAAMTRVGLHRASEPSRRNG